MEELYKVEKVDEFNWLLHYKDTRLDINGTPFEMEVRTMNYSENNIQAQIEELEKSKVLCDEKIVALKKELEEIERIKNQG